MCRGFLLLISSSLLLGSSYSAAAESADESRLKAFAEHQKETRQFGKAREAGEISWLEEQERWDEVRRKDAEAYTRNRKASSMTDDSPLAKADQIQKDDYKKEQEAERERFVIKKEKEQKQIARGVGGIPTESEELGLDEERPRYDYRKRASFGARSKWGGSASGGSSSGSGASGRGGFGSGGGSSLPPPPTFDDIDTGYVPAPNMDDFGDIPPPPPPPPMYDNDFGGGSGNGEFVPPPPPPPNFGDDDF